MYRFLAIHSTTGICLHLKISPTFAFDRCERTLRVYLHHASVSTLSSLITVESLQIGGATHFQATPLFSMRTVSLASSQSCRSVDSDAWCKQTLRRRKTEEGRMIVKEYGRRYVTYHHAEGGGPRTCCPSATNSAPAYWTPQPLPLGSTAPPTSGAPPCSPCSSRPPGRLLGHHPVRRARRMNRTSGNEDSVVVNVDVVVLLDVSVVVVV